MEKKRTINRNLTGLLWGVLCAALFLADRLSKEYMLENLKPVSTKTVWDGILRFTFVENRGAAFGIGQGKIGFFVVITIIIGVVLVYFAAKLVRKGKYPSVVFSLILILAGALGNFYDRVVYGYVVDFFDLAFMDFPVFNVADIFVVCGTIILVLLLLFVVKEDF